MKHAREVMRDQLHALVVSWLEQRNALTAQQLREPNETTAEQIANLESSIKHMKDIIFALNRENL